MIRAFLLRVALLLAMLSSPAVAQTSDPDASAALGLAVQAKALAQPWRVPPYLGVVVDKARLDTMVSGSNTRAMAVTEYRATSPIARPRVIHYNRYISTAQNETDGSAAETVTNWIEYPIGATVSASVVGTAAPGGKIVNDMGAIAIPRGAHFRVWSLIEGPLIHYTGQGGGAAIGATIQFGASAPSTPTAGAMVTTPSGSNGYFPIVADLTTAPTVMLVDDSHGYGFGDTLDLTGYLGYEERYYAGTIGLINGSQAGDSLAKYLTAGNRSMRLDAMQYASDIGINLAGNDITNGVTGAAIVTSLTTAAAEVPAGKRRFTTTEFPKTTATDSTIGCSTVANQTVTANEANRLAVNLFKRSGRIFDYYVDFEKPDAAASGTAIVWAPSPYTGTMTADCIHPNRVGYIEAARGAGQVVPAP